MLNRTRTAAGAVFGILWAAASLAAQILIPFFVALFLAFVVVFTIGVVSYGIWYAIKGTPGFLRAMIFGVPDDEREERDLEREYDSYESDEYDLWERSREDDRLDEPVEIPIDEYDDEDHHEGGDDYWRYPRW